MPITLLDGILLGFTLVSALLAMVRGASREILSIVSWVAAAFSAYYFYPYVLPYVQPHVDSDKVALAASAGVVFVVVLIVVTLITMRIADFIVDSRIGALDRTLGFLYGVARGVLVVAVALLFFDWLVGPNPPAWITEAKSRPLLQSVGQWIEGFLPDNAEGSIFDRLQPQPDDTGTDNPPAEGAPADNAPAGAAPAE